MSEDDRLIFRCDMCKHFDEPTTECRRKAPQIFSQLVFARERENMYHMYETKWPTVTPDSWCGKWNS